MTEIIFIKRQGKAGEMGLFVSSPVFEEEWSSLKIGAEIKAECTVPANLRYLKFYWALIGKVTENSPDNFLDKEDCSHRVLIEARHYKAVYDNLRDKTEIKARSIAGLSSDTWIRLLRRVTYVITTKFIPGMDENALKAEIEAMIGPDLPPSAPPAPKPRASRAKKSDGAPPHDAPSDGGKGVQDTAGEGEGKEPDSPPSGPSGDPPPGARPPPTNEAEYVAAARSWIAKQTDIHKALDYLDSPAQVELRAACRLSIGANKMIRRELSEHIERTKASVKN